MSRNRSIISSSLTLGVGPGFDSSLIRTSIACNQLTIPSKAVHLISVPSKV
ncbi:hypothetical protein BN903_198 [Halorubrum sp. AJ67]|nr:hypothetical protein BN903_198 [Halorubrum sp. AJ67]